MTLLPPKIVAAAAIGVVLSAGVVSASRAGGDATLRDISRYRGWARITNAPATVPLNQAAFAG